MDSMIIDTLSIFTTRTERKTKMKVHLCIGNIPVARVMDENGEPTGFFKLAISEFGETSGLLAFSGKDWSKAIKFAKANIDGAVFNREQYAATLKAQLLAEAAAKLAVLLAEFDAEDTDSNEEEDDSGEE